MKVWFSIIISSLVIVGVWIATFSIPKPTLDNSASSLAPKEIKEMLSELRGDFQASVKVIDQQKSALSELISNISNTNTEQSENMLSDDELRSLAQQLVDSVNATTTTSTVPEIAPPSEFIPTPKLP